MNITKANQIIVFETNRLLRYYDMEDVDVYAYAINDVTHYKKGDHGYNMADWIDYICVNITFAKTEDEIIHTTRHEFRHLWQNVIFPIESAYWFAWTRRILSDERLYHFSVMELDANRFAFSNTQLDGADFIISQTAKDFKYNNKLWQQLKMNMLWAKEHQDMISENCRDILRQSFS